MYKKVAPIYSYCDIVSDNDWNVIKSTARGETLGCIVGLGITGKTFIIVAVLLSDLF